MAKGDKFNKGKTSVKIGGKTYVRYPPENSAASGLTEKVTLLPSSDGSQGYVLGLSRLSFIVAFYNHYDGQTKEDTGNQVQNRL